MTLARHAVGRIRWITACRHLLLVLAAGMAMPSTLAGAAAENALASASTYQLAVPLTDQDGRVTEFAKWRGQPVLVSMFYTNCEFICPRIVEALKLTEKALRARGRTPPPVLLVTFDPERDDAAALKKTAQERNLTAPGWTLAGTDARNTRKLAAMLDVQYRKLPSGDFNHTSVLILLDAEGRIVGRTGVIGAVDPAFVKLAEAALAKSPAR